MSGYANLREFTKNSPTVEIPCVDATPKSLNGLGRIINPSDFKSHKVTYTHMKDHVTGRLLIIPREETEGKFYVWQENGFSFARNEAVGSGLYTVAKVDVDNPYKFYFREVNYHPECTQIVIPEEKSPFIMILGTSPESLKAYIFDGSCGFEIFSGIWHQPPVLHYTGRLTFLNKQAKSHICVVYDSVKEHGYWLSFSYA